MNIFLILALGLTAISSLAHAAGPAPSPLGENLVGEECEVRVRDDLAAEAGMPADVQIFCGGKAAGLVAYGRFLSSSQQDRAGTQAALLSQYRRSRMEKLITAKAACAEPKWLDEPGARAVAILPCQLKSGGWPQLAVLSVNQGILIAADGSPALLPVMLKVAGLSAERIAAVSSKAYLQTLWGKPVVLATSADLESFRQMIRDARNASSNFNFSQAEDIFRKALDLQAKLLSSNDPALADTLMDLALNVSNQGKAEEAQALFRRAEIIVQKSPFESDRARLATYQGFEAANRGEYAAAQQGARLASAAWRKMAGGSDGNDPQALLRAEAPGTERAELAMALDFEAKMALRNDDVVTAGALASEALQIIVQVDSAPQWWKADIMTTLGEVSIAQGRLSAAETYFNSALAIRRLVSGGGAPTLPILAALGRAYQTEGMNSSAIITFRSAFQIAKSLPQSAEVMSKEQLIPFGAAITDYAETLKDETARQGLYAEAFDAFQLVRSGFIDKTIAKTQARLANDDPKIAALVEELQSAQRQVHVARAELADEQALPDQERSAIAETRLQQTMAEHSRRANALNKQLAGQFPAYHQLANPRPLQLTQLRQRLGDREALVSFIVGKKQSFIQITRRQGNYIEKISEGEAALGETVKALRGALEIQGGSVNEFDLQRAHDLYRSLFGRLEQHLHGVDHLIVAASGPLASLPFGLLVTAAPKSKNYAEALWLGQKFSLSHTPSIQAFYALRNATARRAPPKLMLAMGAPSLLGAAQSGSGDALAMARDGCRPDGPMNASTLRALSPLPETATELRSVAQLLGTDKSTVFLGAQASEENLRQQPLQDYSVLYFATHGLLPGELKCQAEPGLVLSPPAGQAATKDRDGLLDASEIAALKLNADLVVLSACNTAGGGGKFGGEALSGLAEAFFFAGARSLVVSHWQVPSAATAQLLTAMFGVLGPELKGGAGPALRAAQGRLIAQQKTAHPFFWAAFVVVGDGMQANGAQLPSAQAQGPGR
jgi:CHAT domain-containing protein